MPAPTATGQVRVAGVMGTVVSLDVRDAAASAQQVGVAFDDAMRWLHGVDARFSTYKPDSEISRLRRGELVPAAASEDVRDVLRRCEDLRAATGGAFDARARGALDPSAFVKGWAIERAADILRGHGLHDFCLGAGGDLVAAGGAAPAPAWRIGIRHPRDPQAVAAVIAVRDRAVATSGAYERGEHIVDPRSGRAARDVLSVTVAGPDLGVADAYSTAAFALGADGPAWTLTLGRQGYEAMTILAGGRVVCTPGFPPFEEDE